MPKTPEQLREQREAATKQLGEANAEAQAQQRAELDAALQASRTGPFGVVPNTPDAPIQDPAEQTIGPDFEAERARLVVAAAEATLDKPELVEQRGAVKSAQWQVQHSLVGQWRNGDVVQTNVFEQAGVDVQRLVDLGAIAPYEPKDA